MENRKLRIAITHGDTNGVGYEMILKAFTTPELLELCTPIIYGSPKLAAYHSKVLEIPTNFTIISNAREATDGKVNLLTCFDEEIKVDFAHPSKESGVAAIRALDAAITDYREGLYDVLVSAPIDSANINVEGVPFKGLTHYLETCIGKTNDALQIYSNEYLRIATLTNYIDIKDLPNYITKENIIEKVTTLYKTLQKDYRISLPRIAVLALNPDGNGEEEKNIIAPAITQLASEGINAFGPFAADSFWENDEFGMFDAVLAMYHDQGIVPLKTLVQSDNVLTVSGLPIVCTAPALFSPFNDAGKGIVNENCLRQAIYQAIDIFRNRITFEEPYANPLKKLYHEKRDEVEKGRFSNNRQRDNQKNSHSEQKNEE